jgi:BlaI family penicillinase repressor
MNKAITDAELEVMRLLWREKRAMTSAEIKAELEQATKWNKSTIQTLILRLRDKGAVKPLDKYGAAQYIPLVSENQYIRLEVPAFLDRVFDGSAKKLVAALCKNGQLTEDDISELKDFFKVEDDISERRNFFKAEDDISERRDFFKVEDDDNA